MTEATRRVRASNPIWYRPSGEEPNAVVRERVTVELYSSLSIHAPLKPLVHYLVDGTEGEKNVRVAKRPVRRKLTLSAV